MKLRLTLDVDYDAHGVPERDLRKLLEWGVQHAVGEGMLTGSTEAEVNVWKTTVERLDQKVRATTAKPPTIRAECHSDDHNIEISFDAVKWFEDAEGDAILELADCEWGGDYAADAVAEHFEDSTTKRMYDYLHIVNQNETKCGSECHVDKDDALRWLKKNRPKIYAAVKDK